MRFHVGENRRWNEKTFRRRSALIRQGRFLFPGLDRLQHPAVSGLVDYWANGDARLFRISDTQTRRGFDESLHDTIVVFLEHNQARAGRTLLPLVTERRIRRVDDRFVEV